MIPGSQRNCEGAAVCCLNDGKCNLAEYCGVPLVDKIEDLVIPYPQRTDALCRGKRTGEKICTGKSSAAVCELEAIRSDVTCASGMLCCPSTNQCDFAFNCEGIPPVKIPDSALIAKTECQGLPAGSRICSEDGFRSLVCDGSGGISFEGTCKHNLCCKDTGRCPRKDTTCANPCSGVADGNFVCGTPKQGFSCIDELPSNDVATSIYCNTDNTICCAKTKSCSGLSEC